MNKKGKILAALLFFSFLPLAFFSSCDKDTNCYLTVTVLNENRQPVPNAIVLINQTAGQVADTGATGVDGIYKTYFTAPAIMTVNAALPYIEEGEHIGDYRGTGTVRLIEGETVTSTVVLSSDVTYL